MESNYRMSEMADLAKERKQLDEMLEKIPMDQSVWPKEIVEIFNTN